MRSDKGQMYQRKKPSQNRSKATCDAIITAAARILEDHGEVALTTNRIAERAGVSIGSLYQYFSNKNEILVALALRTEKNMPTDSEINALSETRRESQLRIGLRAYINMLQETPKARKAALEAVFQKRGPMGVAYETDRRFKEAGLYDGLSDVDRFVMSRAITGIVQSAVREDYTNLGGQDFEDALVKLARCFLSPSNRPIDGRGL